MKKARKLFIDEHAEQALRENFGYPFPIGLEGAASDISQDSDVIRLVVEEIKQTLIEQGYDVGDDFDNPENWANLNLFQEDSGDLTAYQAPLEEIMVERMEADNPAYDKQLRLSICSDITGDFSHLDTTEDDVKDTVRSSDVQSSKIPKKIFSASSARSNPKQQTQGSKTIEGDSNSMPFPGAEDYTNNSNAFSREGGSSPAPRIEPDNCHSQNSCTSKEWKKKASSDENNRKTGVRFDTVQVRYYEQIVCDNPSCLGGPPIGIGWNYEQAEILNVDEWEYHRGPRRKPGEMIVARHARGQLLREWGYSEKDLVIATRKSRMVQYQRKRTVDNLDHGTQKFEEALESAIRKAKRVFGLGSKNALLQ